MPRPTVSLELTARSAWIWKALPPHAACRTDSCVVRGEIARRFAPRPYGTAFAALRRPTWPDGQVVELGLLSAGSSNHNAELAQGDEGFSGKEGYGAPGEIRTPGLLVRSQEVVLE